MTLTDQTIVLAGCTGQVGKPVAKALAAQGNEVHGLARFKDPAAREEMEAAGIVCHAVDLIDPDLSTVPTDIDHLLNFAVTKTGRWDKDLAANADAAGLLMQHCRAARSVLHCSSTAVYAPTGGEPMSEDSPLGRDHHQHMMPTYSTAKTAAESVASFALEGVRPADHDRPIVRALRRRGRVADVPSAHGPGRPADPGPHRWIPLQRDPPRGHHRPDPGAARRRNHAGHDSQLGQRRGRLGRGMDPLHVRHRRRTRAARSSRPSSRSRAR